MLDGYTAVRAGEVRTVIEKSVFLTVTRPIENEEQAAEIIEGLRKKYPDATHVCYGYIADVAGTVQRFSDDGEPSGTAGMPILEVMKHGGLRRSLVAVVRWFGGIKLGAGGLTRAYAGCAAEAIQTVGTSNYRKLRVYTVTVDFSSANKIKKIPVQILCKIERIEYNSDVTFTVYATDELPHAVAQASCGRATTVEHGEAYVSTESTL